LKQGRLAAANLIPTLGGVRFGWICDGPLSGGETKNRTFVWWLDLADTGLTASGDLYAGADIRVGTTR